MADAPSNQSYVLTNPDSSGLLTQARTLTANPATGIQLQDSGAGQPLTIAPSGMLSSVQALSTNGIIAKTATNTATIRTLEGDSTINVEDGDGVSGNPTFGVNDNTSVQQIVVQYNGSEVGTRAQINLIPAGSLNITAIDNGAQDRVDVTLNAIAAPIDAPIWVSEANGTLSDEVDIGALSPGLLKIGVSGGYATPATAVPGTDYLKPAQATTNPTTLLESGTKIFWGNGTGNLANLGGSSQSVVIGYSSLLNGQSCNGSTSIGYSSFGSVTTGAIDSVGVGHSAGGSQLEYNQCTYVGRGADSSANSLINAGGFGYGATAAQSNMISLGNGARTCINRSNPGAIGSSPFGLQLGTDSGSVAPQVYMTSSTNPTIGQITAGDGVFSVNSSLPKFSTSAANYTLAINPMTTAGDVIVGGASGVPTRVAAGTSGYVFTSNGPGVAPSYQAVSTPNTPLVYTATYASNSTWPASQGTGTGIISYTPSAALLALLRSAGAGELVVSLTGSFALATFSASDEIQFLISTNLHTGSGVTLNCENAIGSISSITASTPLADIADPSAALLQIRCLVTSASGTVNLGFIPETIFVTYYPAGLE